MSGEEERGGGRKGKARLLRHPLLGSDLRTLLGTVRRNGSVPPGRYPHLLAAVASAALRWPFRAAERGWARRASGRASPIRRPLFVVGHWRSGTTHLYNLLSRDPRFVYPHPLATGLPWEFVSLGRLFRPLLERTLPDDRWVDPLPVRPDSPQEDEIALASMQTVSFYHGIYFPRRFRESVFRGVFFDGCGAAEVEGWKEALGHFLLKLAAEGGGRRILVKNPVYTARVAILRALYPDARFIHIHRNPFEVYQSSRRFWRTLLDELAWQDPGLVSDEEIDQVILDLYPRLMGRLLEDRAALPGNRIVEVRFAELLGRPLPVVERIYDRLDLGGFGDVEPRFSSYLAAVRSYEKRSYRFSPGAVERIGERWAPFLERWEYGVPA
ncbi:MAG TPA: sulfotransferase [Longimicrobiales bacterium]|nr:sulfotransferase [Longimicrobiales bacterium]